MTVRHLHALIVAACISRCNSQLLCEATDGEITFPDRCSSRSKDLCRGGWYLKRSPEECGPDDSADRCVRCEDETYMPNHNSCPACLPTTKCKDNEIENQQYTYTTDRECIPNPSTVPPVLPVTPNCPVCDCPTQSSCPPCPTQQLAMTLSSNTGGQGTSISPTPVPSSAANVTQERPGGLIGVDDFWMYLAIVFIALFLLAVVIIVVLGCILREKRGVCPQCKKKGENDALNECEIQYINPQIGPRRHKPDEDHADYRPNEMQNRNPQNGHRRHEPDEDRADYRPNEMQNRNPQNGHRRHEPDEAHGGEVHADSRGIEMQNRNPQNGPRTPEPDEAQDGEVPAHSRHHDSRISSPRKDEAPEPHGNQVLAEGHLNPARSSRNTIFISMEPGTSGSTDRSVNTPNSDHEYPFTDEESESDKFSGEKPSTQKLLGNGPGCAEAENGSKNIQNTGPSKEKPKFRPKPKPNLSESMQPLISNQPSSFGTNASSSRETMPTTKNPSMTQSSINDISCILEANESSEKPCGRTTICNRTHMDFVKDSISIKNRNDLFEKLEIPTNKMDAAIHDKIHEGVSEQNRAVLNLWLGVCLDPTIRRLFVALSKSNSNEVVRKFKTAFDVKQKEL